MGTHILITVQEICILFPFIIAHKLSLFEGGKWCPWSQKTKKFRKLELQFVNLTQDVKYKKLSHEKTVQIV